MPIGTTNQKIPGCGSHHIAVQTRDWQASLRFYCDVLGMPIVAQWGDESRGALLDVGDGSCLEIFGPTPGINYEQATTTPPTLPHFALATTDTRKATELVRRAGYEVTVEPKEVDVTPSLRATHSFFKGPSGELVEFFQKY